MVGGNLKGRAMKHKSIALQMQELGYSLSAWGRSRGLSESDIATLMQLSQGTMKGAFGRGAVLRKMLEAEGFKFNCEPKIKPHHKKRKFANLHNGSFGSGDCFVSCDTRNDNGSVSVGDCHDGVSPSRNDDIRAIAVSQ